MVWSFTDPLDNSTYTFSMGPSRSGSPDVKRNMLASTRSSLAGTTLAIAGAQDQSVMEVSGTLLTQAQYNAFLAWWQKDRSLVLTDDLGRTLSVNFTDYTPQRVRAASNPWKHTYTLRFQVLGVVEPIEGSDTLDGGSAASSTGVLYDGGSSSSSGSTVVDGGVPG